MHKTTENHSTFFTLLRAGLWENDVESGTEEIADFDDVLRLAGEQSVMGLIAAGIEHCHSAKIPHDIVYNVLGNTLQIEQRSRKMNDFIALHYDRLINEGIKALLVKGQGIAQCYERPLWRTSGDVDLLLDYDNYEKAKLSITDVASNVMEEDPDMKHWDANVGDFEIELHGTLRSLLLPRMDKVIDAVQNDTFINNHVRFWNVNGVNVALPSIDNDIIFIFTHIVKHLFHEGVGLRQICDWCRLLWSNKSKINEPLLKMRLIDAGLITEWKVFANLAVNYLGTSKDVIPLYECKPKWERKAKRLLGYILETGNFGHNRDNSYFNNTGFIKQKIISLWRHTCDSITLFRIFPKDSLIVWKRMIKTGVKAVAKKKDECGDN